MGTRVWGGEHGACGWGHGDGRVRTFFSGSLLSNFLSYDFISHISMEKWEWCIYLVGSNLSYYVLCFVRFGMEA